jgi:ribonuclease PH
MAKHRSYQRADNALRPLSIRTGAVPYAEGSAEIRLGETHVLVAASVERRVPPFLIDSGKGWVTAEYSMLPRATRTRNAREVARGKVSGRTSEIQRLIGRSLRAALDLSALADHTITLDCDVLTADGGTRTASVTAAWVALVEACAGLYLTGAIKSWPIREQLAAVSVGVCEGVALLDLDYSEDSRAAVDFNVVATATNRLVEVQGTGEEHSFSRSELDSMLDLAFGGLARIWEAQHDAVAPRLAEVEAKDERRKRPTPRDEKTLWGRPPERR